MDYPFSVPEHTFMMPVSLYKTAEAESIVKRSHFNPARPGTVTAICIAGICTVASVNLHASDIQTGRYSMYSAAPTQAQSELLEATVSVQLPARIQTIGETVRYLLQRSGYRLAATESTAPETLALFALPLPAVHRHIGPMTLREALETLAGPAFYLVQDPVHRLITFEQCAVKQVATQKAMNMANAEVAQDDD
jgi:type IV pili sensor histidine kinase/response regulator